MMQRIRTGRTVGAWTLLLLFGVGLPARGADDPAGLEFFEKKVRPVLAEHCFNCHSTRAKKVRGGLLLDSRAAILKGGDNGPALVPGNPDKSRLIEAVRYQNVDLRMPPKGKLPAAAIAALESWVKQGAPWPREDGPRVVIKNQFDLQKRKAAHWAWRPVQAPPSPSVKHQSWPADAVDRFLLARLEEKGIAPAPPADRRTLLRRVSFDLIGLPPTAAEVEAFLNDTSAGAFARVVDRLLASEHFGERWGRHWLDLVRYGETRGHEFDPNIPNAYHYRDYVIRAYNADVPYNQFVTEHLAGDLLQRPRLHPTQGFNESILGTGFWFLGEEVHSPVDIRQDQADRFDNRIDVMTKTFLGLTVACARCHDHKFDAISTRDYYALFGFLESSGYRLARFDSMTHNRRVAEQLWELRRHSQPVLRKALARALRPGVEKLARGTAHRQEKSQPAQESRQAGNVPDVVIDYARASAEWLPDGVAFGPGPVRPGEVRISGDAAHPIVKVFDYAAAEKDPIWNVLRPAAGAENEPGALGRAMRAGRTIRTPAFKITGGKVFYLVKGNGLAYAAVSQHVMINGPLHGQLVLPLGGGDRFHWVVHDLSRYKGLPAHVEFTATDNSDFAVAMVVQAKNAPALPSPSPLPLSLGGRGVGVRGKVANLPPREELLEALARLESGRLADDPHRARLVSWMVQHREKFADPVAFDRVLADAARPFLTEQAKLAARIRAESRLAPAMLDGSGYDEHVFIRGVPRAAGPLVKRRFLEALTGDKPLPGRGSGRLELARRITDPAQNPFIARVMVNRLWHHLFGRGLVASVDNFGVLGEAPTHPELLDHLSARFVKEGWSVKKLIRTLVLTRAYRMSSHPPHPTLSPSGGEGRVRGDKAEQADPQNLLLHRMRVRRLEGEAIRDAMLALSGRLDPTLYGRSVPVHLTPFQDGRGRPASGPLDGNGRRSIYLAVRRNFLSSFLLAFDTPIPFSTVGRRTVSNVPAQALILMNDPFVHQQAALWAKRILAAPGTAEERVGGMYVSAFGRPPSAAELRSCLDFLDRQGRLSGGKQDSPAVWADLAHVLFNVKEFIFLN